MKQEINNAPNKFADVPIRVKTWVYIIVAFAIGLSHPFAMTILVAWIAFQSCFEILRMFEVKTNKIALAVFVGFSQLLLFHFLTSDVYFLYSSGIAILIIAYFLINKVTLKQISGICFALMLCYYIFPHLALLRATTFGVKALIFLVVVTELNDVFQYLMGKFFGKNKITPIISPNKTWEGFVGGVFLTVILSIILGSFLLPSCFLTNSVIGLTLGVLGFFGDVFMSYLKRKTNVKDTGTLLPGHGGLLDRMDSLVFNTPVFFWIAPLLLTL
ncbi:phosphatidate cytidylyltransferase [Flavobacterium ardleyense]|uniref:Phosphatidate cytidylyltransferase n=1 Tax=Flavobacterium ardleyense TaxID=2038737 RepID=A0ABW5Z8Y6_9FLAO